jgi:hypothetical protein
MSALEKFKHAFTDKTTYECFFRYGAEECQISNCGRYIIVENPKVGYAEEFCFDFPESILMDRMLDAQVLCDKTRTAREILGELTPEQLIVTT